MGGQSRNAAEKVSPSDRISPNLSGATDAGLSFILPYQLHFPPLSFNGPVRRTLGDDLLLWSCAHNSGRALSCFQKGTISAMFRGQPDRPAPP